MPACSAVETAGGTSRPCPLDATFQLVAWEDDAGQLTEREVCDLHAVSLLREFHSTGVMVYAEELLAVATPVQQPNEILLSQIQILGEQLAKMRLAIELAASAIRLGKYSEAADALARVAAPGGLPPGKSLNARTFAPDRRVRERRAGDRRQS